MYEAPIVKELGSLHGLTLQFQQKESAPPTDGFQFMGTVLGNAS